MNSSRRPPLLPWLGYNALAVPATLGGLFAGRFLREKAKAGHEGRRRLWTRVRHFAPTVRGGVWFHASSAGEYEQARPLIRAFVEEQRGRESRLPTLLTVFSPSGHAHALENPETDAMEYLPLDTWRAAERMLDAVRPAALVMVKNDCWPNLVWAAHRRGVPTLLLSAALPAGSQRLQPFARGFLRHVYARFDAVGAIDAEDARRFVDELGVAPSRVHVTGDTRVDRVRERWEQAEHSPLVKSFAGREPWRLALGSVWPADERVVLSAAVKAVRSRPEWGLLVAPHEPTPAALERWEAALRAGQLAPTRLSELVEPRTGQRRATAAAKDPRRWRVILVDTVGHLAELYRTTHVAYVGGGFGRGVHSVLEPAAARQPVIFGPRHDNALEAGRLRQAGGGFEIADTAGARRAFERLLSDAAARDDAGAKAQAYVQRQEGATARNLALLQEALVPGSTER